MSQRLKLKLQVMCNDAIAMGPGKADLLDQIEVTGSIASAAREMGMSYRRAWQLVDVMNRCWAARLVETTPGRAAGGARLTQTGREVLAAYRKLQVELGASASGPGWDHLARMVRNAPLPSHHGTTGQATRETA